MNERLASDLYLTVGFPPTLRIEGDLEKVEDAPLSEDDMEDILNSILTIRQRRAFNSDKELNTSLDMGKFGRFRVNVLRQRQSPAIVVRRVISKIPDFETLRLPKVLERLSMMERGFILITGMTGSGKSTTLASMIDYRNANRQGHIITIEDPIEYYHDHRQSVITQREVGVDTESYQVALKNALRQRPDVILVGEVRERNVMEQALTSAETGHLCLATMHTSNANQAIDRTVNFFPEEYHEQIRLNLSMNLRAIISQRLVPCLQGGVTVALEIMLNEGLVRELIQENKIGKIKDIMEQNNSMGMCTFDQSLLQLYVKGLISEETACAQSDRPGDMKIRLKQIAMGEGEEAFKSMDTSLLSIRE